MKKVSLFTILLLSGVGASPAMAALTSADDILSELMIYGAVYGISGDSARTSNGITRNYHGDDVGYKKLANTTNNSAIAGLTDSSFQNHWEVEFPATVLSDGTSLSNGVTVHGKAQCNRIKGTFGVPNYDMTDPYTTETKDGELQCWCKMTSIREGVPANHSTGPADDLGYSVGSSAWVFNSTHGSAAYCAYYCALNCAYRVRYDAGFRAAVFGGGALGHATPADMCGQNLANGKLYDYQVPRVAKLAAGTYTASIAAADGGKWMLRLRGVADNTAVTGEALTAALASSGLALDDSEISNRDGWVFGNASDANALTFTIRSGEYIVEIAKQDATGAQDLMLEHGDVANAYVAPTPCIRIAGTKIAAAAFERADAVRARVVNVVDHVVSQTITQAGHIATLQTQKQTRPADDPTDANNAENCPEGKKCLLVTDENKTPHWYEIFDPIHEWYDAWVTAGKPAVKVEMDGSNYSFYNAFYSGDKAWRKTYIDGSTSTYDRPFDHATRCTNPSYNTETQKARPCYSEVGMFKTLGDGEWAEVYTSGDGTNSPVGVVYGTSKCTSVAGPNNYATANPTKFSELSAANQEKWAELPAPVGQSEREGYERANFKQCWCKVDGVGVPGADGNPANGSIYPVGSSAWVFSITGSSAADCANGCASSCARNVRIYAGFRAAVFGGLE